MHTSASARIGNPRQCRAWSRVRTGVSVEAVDEEAGDGSETGLEAGFGIVAKVEQEEAAKVN